MDTALTYVELSLKLSYLLQSQTKFAYIRITITKCMRPTRSCATKKFVFNCLRNFLPKNISSASAAIFIEKKKIECL